MIAVHFILVWSIIVDDTVPCNMKRMYYTLLRSILQWNFAFIYEGVIGLFAHSSWWRHKRRSYKSTTCITYKILYKHKHKHILLTNLEPSRAIQFIYKERRSKFIASIQYTFKQRLEHIFSNNIILWLGTTPTLHLV